MTLNSGTLLGPYEILSPLGAGGMGEVYRARDTKLGRDVAVKVLPEAVAQHPDVLARFEREARAVAALNHPNILGIYDFGKATVIASRHAPVIASEAKQSDPALAAGSAEQSDPAGSDRHGPSGLAMTGEAGGAVAYAVMELLEGETSAPGSTNGRPPPAASRRDRDPDREGARRRARKGDHPSRPEAGESLPDARRARQDPRLRPREGAFGLETAATSAPTTPAGTEPGTVMGTVGYMSPEQVRGRDVDQRTDIFSFGAILYEMLSGRRAFKERLGRRDDERDPEGRAAGAARESGRKISPALDRIVRHCLEKNPEARFHSAGDVAFDLEALSGSTSEQLRREALRVGAAGARPAGSPPAPPLSALLAAAYFAGRGRSARAGPDRSRA